VIGLPPFAGATNVTVMCVAAAAVVGWAGVAGTVLGTAEADAGDSPPLPTVLVAWTVHV